MSQEEIKSQSELYKFVEFHNLQNSHSQINFYAIVNIFTDHSQIDEYEMEVWIFKDVYNRRGKVSLLGKFDPHRFPGEFYPDYQSMKHVNNEYLLIEGYHNSNPTIGNYKVEIYPTHRLRD